MATTQVPMLSLEAAKVAADAAQDKAKQMGMGMFPFTSCVLHSALCRITNTTNPTCTPPSTCILIQTNPTSTNPRLHRFQHRPRRRHDAAPALHAHAQCQTHLNSDRHRQSFYSSWPPRAHFQLPEQKLLAWRPSVRDS